MTYPAAALLFLIWSLGMVMFTLAVRVLFEGRPAPARFSTDLDWMVPLASGLALHAFVAWGLTNV